MPNSFIVYKHTSPSGKVYVGITHQRPEDRWQGGLGYRKNPYFFRAILRYGWDNFRHEILSRGLTKEEACVLERALIAYYRSNEKHRGYNLTDGGEFFKHSKESREKMSINRKGKGHRTLSAETKAKLRANHAGGAESKPVLCVETGVVYESTNAAAHSTGIDKSPISRCCRHIPHYNTAGGYHWKYLEEDENGST